MELLEDENGLLPGETEDEAMARREREFEEWEARQKDKAGGKKDKGRVNLPEAEALIAWLKSNLESDPQLARASVGIISLGGSEQARKLRSLLLIHFTDTQIARHAMVVGDPSSFQGDERDLILLSLTAVPGERSTVATIGMDAARKYNVALSRARDRMVLFRSIKPEHVTNPDDLKLWVMQFFMRGGYAVFTPLESSPCHARGRHGGHGASSTASSPQALEA